MSVSSAVEFEAMGLQTVRNNTIPNVKWELVLVSEVNCTMWLFFFRFRCDLWKFSMSFCFISKEYMADKEGISTLSKKPLAELLVWVKSEFGTCTHCKWHGYSNYSWRTCHMING
jgi:hypothetical protein